MLCEESLLLLLLLFLVTQMDMGTNAVMIVKKNLLLVLKVVALLTLFLLKRIRVIISIRMCVHLCGAAKQSFLTAVTITTNFGHRMMDPASIHNLLVRNVTNCIIQVLFMCRLCLW